MRLIHITKICDQCKKEFHPWDTRPNQKHCSRLCYVASRSVLVNLDGEPAKRCSACKDIKLLTEYRKDSSRPSGYCMKCSKCADESHAEYRKGKKYKAYLHKRSREPIVRFRKGRDSAKLRGYDWMLNEIEYGDLLKNVCHYCLQSIGETGTGLDRKNNEPFYSIDSCVPCCGRCNGTFMDQYNYDEKMILAETIRVIDQKRISNP
jgi:hypothetical protein